MKYLKKIGNFLMSLVVPQVCMQCGADDELVCCDCIEKITIDSLSSAQKILAVNEYIDQIWIACDYDVDIVHDLVFSAKFYGSRNACRVLGEIVFRFWQISDINKFYQGSQFSFVPIPLHRVRRYQRGFNQSKLIAKVLSEQVNMPISDCLQRVRNTKQQVKLDAQSRKTNVSKCFMVKSNTAPKNCLIIDDVVTTGATINDAARALKQAGAECVNALIVAKH